MVTLVAWVSNLPIFWAMRLVLKNIRSNRFFISENYWVKITSECTGNLNQIFLAKLHF
jgi:hypothetical protein